MTSGRWDILATENDWHGANCARLWAVAEPCNCGLVELVNRIELDCVERLRAEARPPEGLDAPSDPIDEAWAAVKQAVVRYGDERGREAFRAAVAEEAAARLAAGGAR